MKTAAKKKIKWGLPAALSIPLLLVGLFYLLRGDQPLMDRWVYGVMLPVEQFWGRVWSIFPFSMMEVLVVLFLTGNVVWLVRAVVLAVRGSGWRALLRRTLALAAAWLWLWCGLCWLWNPAYQASSFTQRSGLDVSPYSPVELLLTTEYFASRAAQLSTQVERDEEGHYAKDWRESFETGPSVYENLTSEFPFLYMESVRAKPLICSKLQSILGFTGIYFPFTGEANVNVDAPLCLVPATVAHEMSHQRMVASELEANFVGIAACVSCDDVHFQYSGYLMGLIELCNALYPIAPDAWDAIVDYYFTPELSADWNDNYHYWDALESDVEEVAEQTYDAFLKSNDQPLGIRSYGACVDLLVAYFCPER